MRELCDSRPAEAVLGATDQSPGNPRSIIQDIPQESATSESKPRIGPLKTDNLTWDDRHWFWYRAPNTRLLLCCSYNSTAVYLTYTMIVFRFLWCLLGIAGPVSNEGSSNSLAFWQSPLSEKDGIRNELNFFPFRHEPRMQHS
jgi:hypothetical protein